MKVDTKNGIGLYDSDQLESEGIAQIYDENNCVFGEIYEDGEVVLFSSIDEK